MHVPRHLRQIRPFSTSCGDEDLRNAVDRVPWRRTTSSAFSASRIIKVPRPDLSTLQCGASMPLFPSHPPSDHIDDVDDVDFIALSLTPFGWRRRIAERLLAGDPPGRILNRLIAARPA